MSVVCNVKKIYNSKYRCKCPSEKEMTSFGWKRKIPKNCSSTRSKLFDESNVKNTDDEELGEDFDWVAVAKKKKLLALEDNKALFSRLKQEGVQLAEHGKFWQAISHWDNALAIDSSGNPLIVNVYSLFYGLFCKALALNALVRCTISYALS